MTKINSIATIFFVIFILLSGCKKEPVLTPDNGSSSSEAAVADPGAQNSLNCQPSCERTVDLVAGQHIIVGTVRYKNKPSGFVEVTYTVNAPWKITFISFYIGDCSQIPRNSSGNTIPGQYPYKQTFSTSGVTTATISIPRQSVPTCGCIAAHASVRNSVTGATETAWGRGTRFTYTNWAMYYPYCLGDCPVSCGYSSSHWFGPASTADWGVTSISVGSYSYTKSECIAICNSPNNPPVMPDSKQCFIQVVAAKLSFGTIDEDEPIRSDVAICEAYLRTFNQKLSPSYTPNNDNQTVLDAIYRIKDWLKKNSCE